MPIKITNKVNEVIRRDKKVMFTTTRELYPFVADHGSGDYVYDIANNRYLDFSSFISVYNFGVNGNAEIRKAVKDQADKLMHGAFLDYYAELPVKFAESLVSMMPRGFGRVFFSNSGTEANEDAIKLAKLFTKRNYIIGFYGAFHGRSLGSLGLTSTSTKHREHFGPFPNVVHALYPYPYRCPFGTDDPEECSKMCISHIERNILAKEYSPKEVAAIFVEPIQGEGGYIVPPASFIKELRRIADEHGILLVSDEVQSGYMRTGKFLAMDNFKVTADIYTMAKALGAGLPAGATIAKSSFGDTPSGSHAGTFGGNLLAMAAGNASLSYLKRNRRRIEQGVKEKGRYVMKRLNRMKENYEIVGDVRGIGLMIGVELVKSKKTKAPAASERSIILDGCFKDGLLMLPCGASTIRIIPPLTIERAHLERGMDILEENIRKASASIKA
ncbi:MAG TPA: aminotransferase class III-fold pyridoxal phosphate-dependent enzyme [Candidatus Acidoferrum sp.]|nr:aminotransferase class III-fold pyridoxal phosphate-dependent enzyme [Candidatus Acidoferrum sp.]